MQGGLGTGGENLGWGGGNKVLDFFNVVLNKKTVEQQRDDPSLPQSYQSTASKKDALAGSVFKKFVPERKDKTPNPVPSSCPVWSLAIRWPTQTPGAPPTSPHPR